MTQHHLDHMPAWSRPIRIPEGIEITHADPPFALAGETSTWVLPFMLSKDVDADATLKLQLAGGRNNKGFFTCQTPTITLNSGLTLDIIGGSDGTYILSMPAAGLYKGDQLTVTLVNGKAPIVRQLNKFFVLYIEAPEAESNDPPHWAGGSVWTSGTDDRMVAACAMHILGGTIDHLRAYVPSYTSPGEKFHILIRPEDDFDNLSHERPTSLAVFLGEEEIPAQFENVDGSTCMRCAVTLHREGTHRLRVVAKNTHLEATTNPIVCGKDSGVYWGMIHGHTEMSDGTGTLDQYFHQLKNEVALDFAASSDHDHLWETSDAFWQTTCTAVKRWHKPGEFVTFLGYEWAKWRQNGDGDRNVYYLNDDRPMYRSDDGEFPSPPDLFSVLTRNQEKALVIPHHTGHIGNFCDWKDHDARYEHLVEIFQIRGSYECAEQDGNPAPERPSTVLPYEQGYVRNALALGWRVGFTGGGDDHVGQWGTEARIDFYKQGLMAVEADTHSREAIFTAMLDRRVVATTGARMLLTYRINGYPMGTELSLDTTPELGTHRRFDITFHGTDAVAYLDIIRNNTVVFEMSGNAELDLCVTWEDPDAIDDIWMPPAKFCEHPFIFYYVRVVQKDGEVAWASPVWIDP